MSAALASARDLAGLAIFLTGLALALKALGVS